MRKPCRLKNVVMMVLFVTPMLLSAGGCVMKREPQVLVEPTYSHVREEKLAARSHGESRPLDERASAAVPTDDTQD